MPNIYELDTVASNNSAVGGMNWAEGQLPGTVNNSGRQFAALIAQFMGDIGGALEAGGTADALTVTANSDFTAYDDGRMVAFKATADNTGPVTLNVNIIGAKSIRKMDAEGADIPLAAGDIRNGGIYMVRYSSDANSAAGGWILDWAPKKSSVGDYTPVGTVADFAGSTAPTGWLLCFGQEISRATYADLFAVTGTTYGVGDGSTTFNLPDLRGRVVAGKDNMGGVSADRLTNQAGGIDGDTLGDTGGAETHALTASENGPHTHGSGSLTTTSAGNHNHTVTLNDKAGAEGNGAEATNGTANGFTDSTSTDGAHTHNITGSTASSGSGSAHNNVQPTIILSKIIFTGVE